MNNLTPRAQAVLAQAKTIANDVCNDFIGTEHILVALAKADGEAIGIDWKLAASLLPKGLSGLVRTFIPYTPRVKKILAYAGRLSKEYGYSYVCVDAILLAMLSETAGVGDQLTSNQILLKLGIHPQTLKNKVEKRFREKHDQEGEHPVKVQHTDNPCAEVYAGTCKLKEVEPGTPWKKALGKTIESIEISEVKHSRHTLMLNGCESGGVENTRYIRIKFTDGTHIVHKEK